MKNKKGFLIFLLMNLLFLVACGNKDKTIDLSNKKSMSFDDVTIQPIGATIVDNQLNLKVKWKHGFNEDGMTKKRLNSTGVLFFAKQNNKDLKWDLINSQNFNDSIYEAVEREVILKFDLDNETDPIDVNVTRHSEPISNGEFSININ